MSACGKHAYVLDNATILYTLLHITIPENFYVAVNWRMWTAEFHFNQRRLS